MSMLPKEEYKGYTIKVQAGIDIGLEETATPHFYTIHKPWPGFTNLQGITPYSDPKEALQAAREFVDELVKAKEAADGVVTPRSA